MKKPFELTEKQIETLRENAEKEVGDRKKVLSFEDHFIDTDTDTGDFDSEKGAMCDYEISLYNAKGELVAEATGGYYTAVTGQCFNSETFYPVIPLTPEKQKELDFNDFLESVANESGTIEVKVKKIEKYIAKLKL